MGATRSSIVKAAVVAAASAALLWWAWKRLVVVGALLYALPFWVFFSGSVPLAVPEGVPAAGQAAPIPKILHQTWKDTDVPERWRWAQESCKSLHPDWEYRLWTDADAEQFIATKYPWFLETYHRYPHTIQRVDAMRYFILYEYGGVYMDLDIGCLKNLDFLRYYNFTAPNTDFGLSNDIMASRPHDPFTGRLINTLKTWSTTFGLKYVTVIFTTGPMFVTVQYALHGTKDHASMIPRRIYSENTYLKHIAGSSWHGEDAGLVFWLQGHWQALVALAVVAAALGLARLLYPAKSGGARKKQVGKAQ